MIAGSAGLIWFSQALTLMQLVGGVLIVGAITWMQLKSTNPVPVQTSIRNQNSSYVNAYNSSVMISVHMYNEP